MLGSYKISNEALDIECSEDVMIYHSGEGNYEITSDILDKYGMDVNKKNNLGDCGLMAAAKGGHTKVLKLLVENHADVNAVCFRQRNALHYAVKGNHLEMGEFLIEKEIDVNKQDMSGWTPLHVADVQNRTNFKILLLENGANGNIVDSTGRPALKKDQLTLQMDFSIDQENREAQRIASKQEQKDNQESNDNDSDNDNDNGDDTVEYESNNNNDNNNDNDNMESPEGSPRAGDIVLDEQPWEDSAEDLTNESMDDSDHSLPSTPRPAGSPREADMEVQFSDEDDDRESPRNPYLAFDREQMESESHSLPSDSPIMNSHADFGTFYNADSPSPQAVSPTPSPRSPVDPDRAHHVYTHLASQCSGSSMF